DTISKDSESIRLYDELSLHTGLTYDEIEKDLEDKKNILEWMVRQDIHNINDVGKVMAHYYLDSDSIVKIAKRNERPDFL
ncbi:MAG: hypothetical protein QXI10_01105, partial [Candidatus Diapherotrites archaeon]